MPCKKNGYGQIKVGNTMRNAHRVSYEIYNGHVPEGLHVLHRCNTKCCVNPAHLYAGTHQDNMDDLFNAGYRKTATGEAHGSYKHGQYIGDRKRKAANKLANARIPGNDEAARKAAS